MVQRIAKHELVHAQLALAVVIALQILVWKIDSELLIGTQYILIITEIVLAMLISFSVSRGTPPKPGLNHAFVIVLLALISAANISSLILVVHSLVVTHTDISGPELLVAAIAIFITNIIVFALWYWEIDSPGLSRTRWSRNTQDFLFPQQEKKQEFPDWHSEFLDYVYLSVTNAINFAPADTKPLSHPAKLLMGSQALVSVFTLALVIARSVSILGA